MFIGRSAQLAYGVIAHDTRLLKFIMCFTDKLRTVLGSFDVALEMLIDCVCV